MPELLSRSLVRRGWAGKILLILFALALASGAFRHALAGTDDPGQEPQREIRGLVIFKIPFGTAKRTRLVPEMGLDLSVNKPEDELYKDERFDRRTGAKLPEVDMESVPTWSLDKLARPQAKAPGQPARREGRPGPRNRIEGLSKYGVPTLPEK